MANNLYVPPRWAGTARKDGRGAIRVISNPAPRPGGPIRFIITPENDADLKREARARLLEAVTPPGADRDAAKEKARIRLSSAVQSRAPAGATPLSATEKRAAMLRELRAADAVDRRAEAQRRAQRMARAARRAQGGR
jgi:hypothetical protein